MDPVFVLRKIFVRRQVQTFQFSCKDTRCKLFSLLSPTPTDRSNVVQSHRSCLALASLKSAGQWEAQQTPQSGPPLSALPPTDNTNHQVAAVNQRRSTRDAITINRCPSARRRRHCAATHTVPTVYRRAPHNVDRLQQSDNTGAKWTDPSKMTFRAEINHEVCAKQYRLIQKHICSHGRFQIPSKSVFTHNSKLP